MTTTQHLTVDEIRLIGQIAERAVSLYSQLDMLEDRSRKFAVMGIADELVTVHRDVVRLRLKEMLTGSDFDLVHDVSGIHRHLDYGRKGTPPKLRDCFMPRYAMHALA